MASQIWRAAARMPSASGSTPTWRRPRRGCSVAISARPCPSSGNPHGLKAFVTRRLLESGFDLVAPARSDGTAGRSAALVAGVAPADPPRRVRRSAASSPTRRVARGDGGRRHRVPCRRPQRSGVQLEGGRCDPYADPGSAGQCLRTALGAQRPPRVPGPDARLGSPPAREGAARVRRPRQCQAASSRAHPTGAA
jgi:hypothetical protein